MADSLFIQYLCGYGNNDFQQLGSKLNSTKYVDSSLLRQLPQIETIFSSEPTQQINTEKHVNLWLLEENNKLEHIELIVSGWDFTWVIFQQTNEKDVSTQRHTIFGETPPLCILRALQFLGGETFKDFEITLEAYFKTCSLFQKASQEGKFITQSLAQKIESKGQVILLKGGSLYISTRLLYNLASINKKATYELVSKNVKDVVCTTDTIVVLKIDGFLYSCNIQSFSKQLFASELIFETLFQRLLPYQEIEELDSRQTILYPGGFQLRFTKLSRGNAHFMAVSQNKDLFTWGTSRYGETGHGDLIFRARPTLAMGLAGIPIRSIACGAHHSAVLSVYGDVYTFGSNRQGQLGRSSILAPDETSLDSYGLPSLVHFTGLDEAPDCMMIKCGLNHTIAIEDNGVIWSTNKNFSNSNSIDSFQDQIQSDSSCKSSFTKLTFNDNTRRVCRFVEAGYNTTFIGF